jgi:predicted GNAT family N-acyltransferase
MSSDDHAFHVRPVPAGAIVDLRHRVLRPGRPRETAMFDGDDLPTSHHFAAIDGGGRIIGCASFHLNPFEGEPAWQLRGVATDAGWVGRGVGRRVLTAGEADVLGRTPRLMWCNARAEAVGFYERLGWSVCSETFDVPFVGPHYRMRKRG